jgi:hypothetical protein
MFVLAVVKSPLVVALQRAIERKSGSWSNPVSEGAGNMLANTVVASWLCMAGFLVVLGMQNRDAYVGTLMVAVFLAVGVRLGFYIRQHTRLTLLLSLALSSLVALFAVGIVLIAFRLWIKLG